MVTGSNNGASGYGNEKNSRTEFDLLKPDENLFERVLKNRDEMAYRTLYERHWSSLRDCAMRVIKDHSRAEDVAQEVFLILWKEPEKLVEIRNLKSYLCRMAINRSIDLLRREAWFEPADINSNVIGTDGFVNVNSFAFESSEDIWYDMQNTLTQIQFRMCVLRFKFGFTMTECSVILGIPEGTVKSRMNAAMKKLRKMKKIRTIRASHSFIP